MIVVEQRLPRRPESALLARRALDGLVGSVPGSALENVRLLVSELVTNSIRHADPKDGPISVKIDLLPQIIRVEVTDPGNGFEPEVREPTMFSSSGWGLYLVRRVADRWGVDRIPNTLVWFEIDIPS